jgi:cytochrome c-type biogenesis protein CcmH
LLARSYQQLERHREAVGALERAVKVSGRDPQYLAALGEARIIAAGGTVPPQARAEFEEVLKADPKNPRSRFYVALAEAQAGNLQPALDRLVAMARETPADAPYLPMLRERIGSLAQEMKQDPAKLLAGLPAPQAPAQRPLPPAPAQAPERGPSAADIAAAQQMSPEARQQMIRGMVEGLAARLESEPGDVEGWLRLMRAYKVQGEDEKAASAAARAASANPAQRQRIAATAQQLGIAMGAPPPQQASAPPAMPLDAQAIGAGTPVAPERLSALRQLLLLKPDDREALFQVGLAEAAQGNRLAAAELWGRLIAQYSPQSPEYRALRQRLDGLK